MGPKGCGALRKTLLPSLPQRQSANVSGCVGWSEDTETFSDASGEEELFLRAKKRAVWLLRLGPRCRKARLGLLSRAQAKLLSEVTRRRSYQASTCVTIGLSRDNEVMLPPAYNSAPTGSRAQASALSLTETLPTL